MLRHVVLFQWAEGSSEEERRAIREGLEALPAVIPEIRRYDVGRDLALAEGNFDFAVVADFDSRAEFEVYRTHPEHQRIVRDLIRPAISQRAAVQYRIPPRGREATG